jgi:hypothetical protein
VPPIRGRSGLGFSNVSTMFSNRVSVLQSTSNRRASLCFLGREGGVCGRGGEGSASQIRVVTVFRDSLQSTSSGRGLSDEDFQEDPRVAAHGIPFTNDVYSSPVNSFEVHPSPFVYPASMINDGVVMYPSSYSCIRKSLTPVLALYQIIGSAIYKYMIDLNGTTSQKLCMA